MYMKEHAYVFMYTVERVTNCHTYFYVYVCVSDLYKYTLDHFCTVYSQ